MKATGKYVRVRAPENPRANKLGYVFEHILVAENALGRHLGPKNVVHHINGVRDDNRPENLVICEDNSYHMTLHRRHRAVESGYPADWRQCLHCRQYEAPMETFLVRIDARGRLYHLSCANTDRLARHQQKSSGGRVHKYRDAPLPYPPHWRRCAYCKQYDDPQVNAQLKVTNYGMVYHTQCAGSRRSVLSAQARAASAALRHQMAQQKEVPQS